MAFLFIRFDFTPQIQAPRQLFCVSSCKGGRFSFTFPVTEESAAFARQLLDFEPDANQAKLLSTKAQYVMMNCHRQWGKTTMTDVGAANCGGVGITETIGEPVPSRALSGPELKALDTS